MEAKTSTGKRLLKSMSLRVVLSQAEGYPVVIKQFLQFCLILIYPAWIVGVLVGAALYYSVYAVLWVLFWPVRAWMKKNRPEEYAASQKK
jgi:YggT family protein